MPFTASFTVSQSADGTQLTITDTSNYGTEGKGTFSSRSLSILMSDGNPLPGTPVIFSFANYPNDFVTIPIEKDYSLNITLTLVSTNPQPGSVYVSQRIVTTIVFSNLFLFSICQNVASNPSVLQIPDFYTNWQAAEVNYAAALRATDYSDQFSAQAALNRLQQIINNKTILFQ